MRNTGHEDAVANAARKTEQRIRREQLRRLDIQAAAQAAGRWKRSV